MRFPFVLSILLGCASSPPRATPPPPVVAPAPAAQIHYEDFDLHEVEKRWARISVDCAQAVVLEIPAKGFRWGEAIWVYAHGDHDVVGQIEFDNGGGKMSTHFKTRKTGSWSINDTEPSQKCDDALSTPTTKAPGPGAAPSGGATETGAGGAPTKAVDIGFTFDASIRADARPPKVIFAHNFGHETHASLEVPPQSTGTKLRIRFWGMKSIDWSGFVFAIGHYELKPKDPIAWRAKIEAERARHKAIMAKVHAAPPPPPVAAPSTPYVPEPQTSTGTPPPPPVAESPSPKPSDGATWVSGRWVWDGFKWSFWSKGFWRIPDSDREGKHTPTAPGLPPPPKNETPSASPIPGAVWTPGYWHWNVSVWLWVDGAWRVPPIAGAKWRPFVWRVEASGTIRLDPGGWLAP